MTRRLSRPQGMVSLADALIALDGLSGERRRMAWEWLPELIGMGRSAPDPAPPQDPTGLPGGGPGQHTSGRETGLARRHAREARERKFQASDPARRQERRHAPTLPARLVSREADDPEWLTETGDDLGEARPFRPADIPPLLPLFEPRRRRSVLSSALATPRPDGDLDMDALLDAVSRRQAITRLPRLTIPTTRLGLQLLLDRSDAMLPYRRDQLELARAIRDTVGRDGVDELRFDGDPARGVARGDGAGRDQAYRSPASGTPVVLLTDLGIGETRAGRSARIEKSWLGFARRLRMAGCPVLAVVPYAPERIPLRLRTWFQILPWSRTTTVATVRQWIGRGLSPRP